MATLVLGAAGAALAGPWGALAGSLVGQSVDGSLLGQVQKGPRLGDLAVQTSQYGNAVPRIYGTMRVAGTVVWATDLIEGGELVSGGKSGPDTLSYTYSASFAVALSSRTARRVRRIWADGQLLRGAADDFKVPTGFRFYPGSEDQLVDPLIASNEGIRRTPAFRGLAIAVFDQLQLASFGNRIPVLTFEVEADVTEPGLADIFLDVSRGRMEVTDGASVGGYAAHGASIEDALAPLVSAAGLKLWDGRGAVRQAASSREVSVAREIVGCGSSSDEPRPWRERRTSARSDLPSALSLTHYNPALDYQAGEQRASVSAASGNLERIALPAVLGSEQAKRWSEEALTRQWVERDRMRVRLPIHHADLEPGDRLILPDGERWTVQRVSIEQYVVVADCLRAEKAVVVHQPADAGRHVGQTDIVASPTQLALLNLPLGSSTSEKPVLHLAAWGGATPWRAVPVTLEVGGSEIAARTAAKPCIHGTTSSRLGSSGSTLIDTKNDLVVQLSNEDQWLRNCDDAALQAGENLTVIGRELVQFGRAEPLGGGKFKLSRLLRGRFGTEWAAASHAAGELFLLLDPQALAAVELPTSALNADVRAVARGPGDSVEPLPATSKVVGENLRSLAPARLEAKLREDGALQLSWVRRTRSGFAWIDGVDVLPVKGVPQYRVEMAAGAVTWTQQVASETLLVPTSELGFPAGVSLTVSVSEIGASLPSPPTSIVINPAGEVA